MILMYKVTVNPILIFLNELELIYIPENYIDLEILFTASYISVKVWLFFPLNQ